MFEYLKKIISYRRCKKYEEEITYLNHRVESLTKSVGNALIPTKINFTPSKSIKIPKINGLDIIVADSEYDAFPLKEWETILDNVYNNIRFNEKYTGDVFDCDDFALVFSSVVAYSAFISSFARQVAFGIAWSNIHAFNIFIDNKNNTYIYEPQNNSIMSFNDAIKNKNYDVKKIWFMS